MSGHDTQGDRPSRREQLRTLHTRALVAAITETCRRGTKDEEAVRAALASRTAALAKADAHPLLQGGERISIADTARGAIAAFEFPASRFSLRGAKVDIGANGALTLALILNELGTHAIEYGALSHAGGRVGIEWFVERVTRDFTLTWTEEGGPPVAVPSKKSFGHRLIDEVFAASHGGTAQIEFNRDGLVCALCIPLDRLLED